MDPVIITAIVGYICICSLIIAFTYFRSDEIKETVKEQIKEEIKCKINEIL